MGGWWRHRALRWPGCCSLPRVPGTRSTGPWTLSVQLLIALMIAAGLPAAITSATSRAQSPIRAIAVSAATAVAQNPLTDPRTKRPLSCPDPSVLDHSSGGYKMFMVCTSDFDANAFPVWASNDGVHWTLQCYVFPKGHQPWWAQRAGSGGRYWGPDLQFIDGRWVLYFAALLNASRARLPAPGHGDEPAMMVIGVATAGQLRGGPWGTKVLHYRGQFNAVAGNEDEQELYGGVIDPSEFQNPSTGQRYLVYAQQSNRIWLGELSSNGLTLEPNVRWILQATEPWTCNAVGKSCTIEGPVGYFYDGLAYVLFSAAGTWSGSYSVGVAASAAPTSQPFLVDPTPILASSFTLLGPGGTSQPVLDLEGNPVIYFHALLGKPDTHHVSADRYLIVSRFSYAGGQTGSLIDQQTQTAVPVTWPTIGNGQPQRFTTMDTTER
jgi:beta-xylosidase